MTKHLPPFEADAHRASPEFQAATAAHTAATCAIESHDHFGQIEAAANGTGRATGDDELKCGDCGRKIFYDEVADDYRHTEDPERGCFLIPAELSLVIVDGKPVA